jgi:DNA-binding CsgD family transcriptional regulator
MLHGRLTELAELDRFVDSTRGGRGAILVIRGEAGSGKSALLDHALGRCDGIRILRYDGVGSEREIPFASLQLLLGDVTGPIEALPAPEAAALRRALGSGAPVVGRQRLVVGMAVVSLLKLLAESTPLLCVLDNMQCLDRASADVLGFAARRLRRLPVSMLAASRVPVPPRHGPFPAMHLGGLDAASSAALLDEHVPDLSDRARTLVIERSGGNPLALIELVRALSPQERAGELSPFALRCRPHVEFVEPVRQLPPGTRAMLALAAAECTGSLDTVLRAGRVIGLAAEDLGPAEDAELIRVGDRMLAFHHPLVQAAAYTACTRTHRLAVHRALATALDSPADAARRAWHLAISAMAPDESIAADLERAAPACGEATLAIYQHSARLSTQPQARARRLVKACHAASVAGRLRLASDLADLADRADPADRLTGGTAAGASVAQARAQIELRRGSVPAAGRYLIEGARMIVDEDPARASAMLTQALRSAWLAADAALATRCADGLSAAASRPGAQPAAAPLARLAHALVALLNHDHVRGYSALRGALPDLTTHCPDHLLTGWAHLAVLDPVAACTAAGSAIARPDASGGPTGLLEATRIVVHANLLAGRHDEAATHLAHAVDRDGGDGRQARPLDALRAALAAVRGDAAGCARLVACAEGADDASDSIGRYALGLAGLGRADHAAALEPLTAARHPLVAWSRLADLIEAAQRCAHPDRAATLLDRLGEWTRHARVPQADAVLMRCRGLVDQDGERLAEAVELAGRADHPFEYARGLLAHGQWLRRSRQRARARDRLRQAVEAFDGLGARPWADQARTELRVAGDVRQAASGPLTPQEREVVRLAAGGATNRQIAATLFISPRTVGYHLYKAYPKLGVESRRDLLRLGPVDAATG